ncbi:MAG: DUF1189 family protein [Eubacterium sp.]|nr:DUF1189 family protein [Eubacterium sp.]
MPISFFKPSRYKELLSLKRRLLVGFVIIVTFLSFALETLIPFLAWDVSVGGLNNMVANGIPAFSLEEGVLEMESPIEIKMTGLIYIKADSSVEAILSEDVNLDYPEVILISKTNMMIKNSGMVYEIKFSDVKQTINNQSLLNIMPLAKVMVVITFILTYLTKVAGYMISVLFFAFISRTMARDKEGRTVPFKTALVFAIYARAPFVLLSGINSCLGNLISPIWIIFLGVFMTMHFIFVAEKAELGIEDRRKG